jgi:hypothetical protein
MQVCLLITLILILKKHFIEMDKQSDKKVSEGKKKEQIRISCAVIGKLSLDRMSDE